MVIKLLEELEGKIKALSPHEFQELRGWLAEYDAEVWDRELQSDVSEARLDAVADQAVDDFAAGRSTNL